MGIYTHVEMAQQAEAISTLPTPPTMPAAEDRSPSTVNSATSEIVAPTSDFASLCEAVVDYDCLSEDAEDSAQNPLPQQQISHPLSGFGVGCPQPQANCSSGGGIRTPDTRIMIPRVHSGKSHSDKDLPKEPNGCCTYVCTSIQVEGDLARLIASWPTLKHTPRQRLLALVQSSAADPSKPRDDSTEASSSSHDELFSDTDWQRLTTHFSLSGRQAEILSLLLSGESDKQIARKLGIAFPTVRTHLQNIYVRVGVSDRTSLVVELFRQARTLLS